MLLRVSKRNSPTQLYLVTGDDLRRISSAADELFKELAGEQPDELSVEVIREDDRGPTPELIKRTINALMTPPFLGGNKTVWLRDFSAFKSEGGASAKKGDEYGIAGLAKLLSQPLPPDLFLLISGPNADSKKALYKSCHANGEVRSFNLPKKRGMWRKEVAEILNAMAEKKHIVLSGAVVSALTDALGVDTSLFDCELEKLINYAGAGQPITVEMVQELCPPYSELESFAIGDPMGRRDLSETLSVIGKLLAQADRPEEQARLLLNQLANLFRQWLELRLYMAEKRIRSSEELRQLISNTSPERRKSLSEQGDKIITLNEWRAKFMADNAMSYTPPELIRAVSTIQSALLSIPYERVLPSVALENTVVSILL